VSFPRRVLGVGLPAHERVAPRLVERPLCLPVRVALGDELAPQLGQFFA